jgi:hypothetical protein
LFQAIEDEPEDPLKEAQAAARETVKILSRGVHLPESIDRRALIDACMSVRHNDDFNLLAAVKTIDHADIVLSDSEQQNHKKDRPSAKPSHAPPCPKNFGMDTHERLWAVLATLPKGWFGIGQLLGDERVRVGERTVRDWLRAMVTDGHLEHNEMRGKASLYRRP